jgi:hypothetical protein
MRIIETATGRVVKDLGETGKSVENESPASSAPREPDPGITDDGWIENSQWRNYAAQPIVYFSTRWIVPPAPSSDDSQTIFLFNGMQPDSAANILQPVLQWGSSRAGGGSYWSITNWWADGQFGPATYQTPINVNPGDVLQGVMSCTGKSAAGFNYLSSFVGYPALDVTATDSEELTWAYETLEAYRPVDPTTGKFLPLSQCSDYPNVAFTAMTEIEIKTGTPGSGGADAVIEWTAVTQFNDCGQTCVIVNNSSPGGEVDLFFRRPLPSWQELDNNPLCKAIAAYGGDLYQLHQNGAIWKYVGPPLTGWQMLDNNPAGIAIAASGGNLYQLHNTGRIWKYVGPPLTGWEELDNNPASVAIAASGDNFYQLHNAGWIWKYVGPPLTGWEELDNNPECVAIAADGNNLYQRQKAGNIWKYVGPGWQELDNNPACMAIAASGGNLYQLHNTGKIWKYVGPPLTGWQELDNNPACVAIAADANNLYQLHNTGKIWKYIGPPLTGWHELDNNPASISITAGGGNVYQLHDNGEIWELAGLTFPF